MAQFTHCNLTTTLWYISNQISSQMKASGGSDKACRIWDLRFEDCSTGVIWEDSSIFSLQFDDSLLVAGCFSSRIEIFDKLGGYIQPIKAYGFPDSSKWCESWNNSK